MWLDVGRDLNIVLGGGVTTSKIVVGGGWWPPKSSWVGVDDLQDRRGWGLMTSKIAVGGGWWPPRSSWVGVDDLQDRRGWGLMTSKIVVGGGCWPPRSSWFFCRPTTKIVEVTQRFDQTHNKSSDANCYQSCCGWGRTTTNYIAHSFLYTHNKKSLFRKLRFRCGSIKCHANRRCSAPQPQRNLRR